MPARAYKQNSHPDGSPTRNLPGMSLLFATQLTAVATVVLAIGAIVTAILAYRAFLKQSREVRAIERQVNDQQELSRRQSQLLKIQSGQLELQRQQFDDQRKVNADQAKVLKLQADELRESLAARQHAAEEQRKAQASKVFIVEAEGLSRPPGGPAAVPFVVARAVNSSDQPVYDVEFCWRRGSAGHGEPTPSRSASSCPASGKKRAATSPTPTCAVRVPSSDFRNAAGVRWIRRCNGGSSWSSGNEGGLPQEDRS